MSLYKIMIVDDEAEIREGIAHKIDWKAVGFEIVADAENGRDALEKAEALDLDGAHRHQNALHGRAGAGGQSCPDASPI